MENNPLISIVVPIYNVESYLEECLNSIVNQSYQNLEIILVDDGSPDKSSILCDIYAQKDDRIIVIHKSNGGLSSARNAGLEICNGEFVAFIDSDDYVHKDFIKLLYQDLINHDSDIASCGIVKYNDKEYPTAPREDIYTQVYTREELHESTFYWRILNIIVNKLYKKAVFENIRFPIGRLHEDDFVIHHIIDQCNTVVFSNHYMYYYRQHRDSIMSSRGIKSYFDASDAFLDRSRFFYERGYAKQAMECAIKSKLFINDGSKLDHSKIWKNKQKETNDIARKALAYMWHSKLGVKSIFSSILRYYFTNISIIKDFRKLI